MSRKQDLERLELQMAKFSPMQERHRKIQQELLLERQGKLYAALHEYVSDAQLDACKKQEIADIVKAHLNGETHALDAVTEKEAARRAEFERELEKAAGRAAGPAKKKAAAKAEPESESVSVAPAQPSSGGIKEANDE